MMKFSQDKGLGCLQFLGRNDIIDSCCGILVILDKLFPEWNHLVQQLIP